MPERGRQHHGHDDLYAQDNYRDRYNTRDNYERSRSTGRSHEERGNGSAGDRRPKPDRYKETSASKDVYFNLNFLGLCQLFEVFVNLLIIICAGVPYSNNGGYRDLASLGGVYAYYFGGANAFTGADAEKVKELDRLFNQLKKPPYIFAMAYAGCVMVYASVMLCLGVFRVPYRLPPVLLVEALLNLLIGLGYIPALAFYFIKLQETYNNSVCKEREHMYKSKGHKGFECQFDGADIAGGLFAVVGVFVFIFGAVLAFRAFRIVRERKNHTAFAIPDPVESLKQCRVGPGWYLNRRLLENTRKPGWL
uniref:MARVEL domain containing 3 n=1 Tax=Neogobius melanostomus TaxID=47308 RepID=A0A8C6T546_9GOBI